MWLAVGPDRDAHELGARDGVERGQLGRPRELREERVGGVERLELQLPERAGAHVVCVPGVDRVVLVGADDELAAARTVEDDGRADEVEVLRDREVGRVVGVLDREVGASFMRCSP